MPNARTEIGTVTYNATEACFEALVTFHTDQGRQRVAASFTAPLTAGFERVSNGLWCDAHIRMNQPGGLKSHLPAASAALPLAA